MKELIPQSAPVPGPAPTSRASPVIDPAPLPMVKLEGPRHVVCFVNVAFCRLLGKPADALVGRPFTEIVSDGVECGEILDQAYDEGAFQLQREHDLQGSNPTFWLQAMWPANDVREQPERVVIQLTRSAQFDQDIAAMNEALLVSGLRQHALREEAERLNVLSLEEIADRVQTEHELRGANDQLRDSSMLERAAKKAKDDFLAQLSHELRTPLTPVLFAAASLREDVRLPADVRQQLDMIERNVTLEARLIDDLLDLTKISSGKLQLRAQVCDAHFLIGLAIEIVRDEARAKGITISRVFTAPLSGLTVDPARFQQVIWNLLRNALKFTPSGGKISIRTSNETVPEGGQWLCIEIVDSGIGIAAESLENIFLPYDQGKLAGNRQYGGVGLGLSIARSVVALHGGRIVAESGGADQGATFIVRLPGATEPESALTPSSSRNSSPPRPKEKMPALRLLLVEDHAATLESLMHLLRTDGHSVTGVENIGDALTAAANHPFDVVISDLGLADGTGVELMEKLRADHGLRGIALSGYGMPEDIARSRAAGFETHLVKPIAIAELRRVVALFGAQKRP